jgi:hypothetical protein
MMAAGARRHRVANRGVLLDQIVVLVDDADADTGIRDESKKAPVTTERRKGVTTP